VARAFYPEWNEGQAVRQPPNLCWARLQPCHNVRRTNTALAAGLLEIELPRWLNRLRKKSTSCHSEARCAPRNLSFPASKGRVPLELGWAEILSVSSLLATMNPNQAPPSPFTVNVLGELRRASNLTILTQSGRTGVVLDCGTETIGWNADGRATRPKPVPRR
jgi:hypothetical protein